MTSGSRLLFFALVGLFALGSVGLANDILFCPIADNHDHEELEIQPAFIYRPLGAPQGGVILNNAYYGVTERLELNMHSAVFVGMQGGNPPPQLQVNVSYELLSSSKPDRPKVTIGAYNLNGGNFLTYNGIEPYVVVSHNLFIPDEGKPEWNDPLVRATVGVGTSAHRLFGGLLCVWDEDVATYVSMHGGRYSLVLNIAAGDENQFDITPAIWNGAPAFKVAYHHRF